MSAVINVTDDTFAQEVKEEKNIPVLVDFWAGWCAPCRMIAPVLDAIAQEYEGRLKVCKVDVDKNSKTSAEYGIMSIPTLVIFKDGEEKERLIGVQSQENLKKVIDNYL
ncbi:MAG: thioredoxin [Clostridia bacterium]|nr:thioredoxin [Clostridia bacterium]